MVAQGIDNMTPQRQGERQPSLFGPNLPSTLDVAGPDVPCDVFAIEKRRDGGTRVLVPRPSGRRHGEGRHAGKQMPRGGRGAHPA